MLPSEVKLSFSLSSPLVLLWILNSALSWHAALLAIDSLAVSLLQTRKRRVSSMYSLLILLDDLQSWSYTVSCLACFSVLLFDACILPSLGQELCQKFKQCGRVGFLNTDYFSSALVFTLTVMSSWIEGLCFYFEPICQTLLAFPAACPT